jgi:Uma2 family endonuclease
MAVESLELESRPPLSVEEFEALVESEGWDEDTRVELLDGEVVWMSPINDPHIGGVNRLNRVFRRYPEDQALVSVQNSIRIDNYDETRPDVALLRPRADDYSTVKASPAAILLLVEVADRTLRTDLGRKARIYASGGVAEYWVVDVQNRVLYVHREPKGGRYASRQMLTIADRISALFSPEVEFEVGELIA